MGVGDQSVLLGHIKSEYQHKLRPDTPRGDPHLLCVEVHDGTAATPSYTLSASVSTFSVNHTKMSCMVACFVEGSSGCFASCAYPGTRRVLIRPWLHHL